MVLTSGKMEIKTLEEVLQVKNISICNERDEIYNNRTDAFINYEDIKRLDGYKFKLIENLNQPVEDYYILVCY